MEAKINTLETMELISELQELTDARCPIFQTLKAAGADIFSIWTKA